jgi:hemerythrin
VTEFSLRVGVPSIDREHLDLVAHLDRLQADADANPGTDAFSEVLSHLGRQINAHFDSEEVILRDCGMPAQSVLGHMRAHTEILDQYARLNLELMHGKPVSREEALVMIREWIVEHVLNHDMKIAEYASATAGTADPA